MDEWDYFKMGSCNFKKSFYFGIVFISSIPLFFWKKYWSVRTEKLHYMKLKKHVFFSKIIYDLETGIVTSKWLLDITSLFSFVLGDLWLSWRTVQWMQTDGWQLPSIIRWSINTWPTAIYKIRGTYIIWEKGDELLLY